LAQILDDQARRAISSHGCPSLCSARLTKRGLALYIIMDVRELCICQQGSTLRRREQNRIELYALLNTKQVINNFLKTALQVLYYWS